jgi:2-deoxy-D-gluconate 3-dehydrogenase
LGLARHGANVAVTEIEERMENAQAVAEEVKGLGTKGLALKLDVENIKEIDETVDAVEKQLGDLDVIFNNAAWRLVTPALDISEEQWDRTLNVTLKGSFFCAQAAARRMIPRGHGKIINTASQLGFTPIPDRAPYSTAKGGIINMTRALAVEWARYHINVNAIAPGATASEQQLVKMQDPEHARDLLSRIPLGRLNEPEDLAGAAVYLASDASSMVTGQTIVVDGGWMVI